MIERENATRDVNVLTQPIGGPHRAEEDEERGT